MRPIFSQSKETQRLVELFVSMSINSQMSFADASKALGFRVASSMPAYQSAKKIAERDHRVVVDGIRGYGFTRIDGTGMVDRAPRFFKKVRKGARREARVQEIAISTNLSRNKMIEATEQLSRLRILETTASRVRPVSNRQEQEPPPVVKHDNRDALRRVGR